MSGFTIFVLISQC